MDEIDRAILVELRRDGRKSFRDLGASVGLSANAVADRVRRLERAGVITGYTAIIEPAAAGRRLEVLVDVRIPGGTDPDVFEGFLQTLDVVQEAAHVSGRYDYQLRISAEDAAELDRTIRALKGQGGVIETQTRLIMRPVMRRPAPLGDRR